MITFEASGSTKRTMDFLSAMESPDRLYSDLASIAQRGVVALQQATPKRSGLTSQSWGYEIEMENDKITISWLNNNVNDGVHVAVILQYGHGTGTGGYVAGQDYINPAMQQVFDDIADSVWKKVRSA